MEEHRWMALVRLMDAPPWMAWTMALISIPLVTWLALYMRRIDREESLARESVER